MTTETGIALVIALVAALLLAHSWARRGGAAERASRPRDLMNAELAYMEKQFRIRDPIPLVARIDRAYRLRNGNLVLVELKTRWVNRVYHSDIVELSAQKFALENQTGESVESYAFVTLLRPTRRRHWMSHRVTLLSAGQLLALARRREEILARRLAPTYAMSVRACTGCAFRSQCDRPDARS